MTKETYTKIIETLKMQIEVINEEKRTAREMYIQSNKPCEIDQEVEIQAHSKIIGKAKSFAIFQDGNVYVSSVSVSKSKTVYISKPYKSILVK
jgi:hypothetical protein